MEAKDYEKAGATSASMMGGIVTTQGIDHPPSKVARTSLDNVTARASTPFVKGTTTSTGLPGERVMPAQATTNSTKAGEIDTSPGECDVLGNNDGKDNTTCSGRHNHNPSIKQSATQNRRTGKRTRPDEDFNFEFEIDFTGYDPGVGGTRAERKIYRKKKLEAAAAAADAKAKAAAAAKVKAAAAAGAKVKAAAIEKETTETGAGAVARAQGKRTNAKGFEVKLEGILKSPTRDEMSISCNRREDLEEVHTIKCCECGKLRALPKLVKLDDMLEICKLQHANVWVCSKNFWNSAFSSCSTPQDKNVFGALNTMSQNLVDSPDHRASPNQQAGRRSESSSSSSNNNNNNKGSNKSSNKSSTSIKARNENIKHDPSNNAIFREARVAASGYNLTHGGTGFSQERPERQGLTGVAGAAGDEGTAWEGGLTGTSESTFVGAKASAGGDKVSGGGVRRVRFCETSDELRDVVDHRLPTSNSTSARGFEVDGIVNKRGQGGGDSQRDKSFHGRTKGASRLRVLLQVSARRLHAGMTNTGRDSAAMAGGEGRYISRNGGEGACGRRSEPVVFGRQGVTEWRSTSESAACVTVTAALSAAPGAMSAPIKTSASAPRDLSSAPFPFGPILEKTPSGAILGKHSRSCSDKGDCCEKDHTAATSGMDAGSTAGGATGAGGAAESKQLGNTEDGGGGAGAGSRPAGGDRPVDRLAVEAQEPDTKRPRHAVVDESTNTENSAKKDRAARAILPRCSELTKEHEEAALSGAATCGGSWRERARDGRSGVVGTPSVPAGVRGRFWMADVREAHDGLAIREEKEMNAVKGLVMLEDVLGNEIETTADSGE